MYENSKFLWFIRPQHNHGIRNLLSHKILHFTSPIVAQWSNLHHSTGRPRGLDFVDLDLGSSPGRWAATVATYCPSRMVEHPKSKSTQPRSSSTWEALYNEIFGEGEEENLTGRHWSVIKTPVSSWNGSMYILCQFPLIGWLSLRFRGARQWSGLHPVYRVVQLNFTPKIQVFYKLSERSHKQHILVWNLVGPTCKIIRQPHSLSQVVHVVLTC